MGLLKRLGLMSLGGLSMFYARWRIMGTGPPAFTEVDNPASFEENIFIRVSKFFFFFLQSARINLKLVKPPFIMEIPGRQVDSTFSFFVMTCSEIM